MPDIKLAQLRDRTPVKLSISVMPDLNQALNDYAARYAWRSNCRLSSRVCALEV
jgi:hypothetical protein